MNHKYEVASVSWPDHLVFGEGDGKLDSVDGLSRRMDTWREQLGTETIHWREVRTRSQLSHYYAAPDNPRTQERKIRSIDWDDFSVAPRLAHERGMRALLYVSILDDGRGLPGEEERRKSYHNDMHGQHVTWQTDWSRDHGQFSMESRDGQTRQTGVFCYGYPEVREHMKNRILSFVEGYEFDGVFICLRSQCRPADFADQFGFNDPVFDDYMRETGRDIRIEDFDLEAWRRLLGDYLTEFLRETSLALGKKGMVLGVGVPRGDIIGPPLGNWQLQWRSWIEEGIVRELVIDQNSSQCPSMWHQLWPMHRGYGYLQNYIDGKNLKSFADQISEDYAPVLAGSDSKLYLARQWYEPDEREEGALLGMTGVDGLVFSTFRYDNPGSVARGDFRA